jgi:uncharacterized SAM-binding protein YcdF (DUF218 family)
VVTAPRPARAGRGRDPRQREGEGQRPANPIADAIVILGCRGSAGLRRRLDLGVRLFRQNAAPLLVLSGGGVGPMPEAEIMRRMALDCGVPEAALLIETASRNTVGNARQTARLLRSHGGGSVLLVSDRAHLPRAALLFRLAGLRIAGWAGPRPPSVWWEAGAGLRECAALPMSLARMLFHREAR